QRVSTRFNSANDQLHVVTDSKAIDLAFEAATAMLFSSELSSHSTLAILRGACLSTKTAYPLFTPLPNAIIAVLLLFVPMFPISSKRMCKFCPPTRPCAKPAVGWSAPRHRVRSWHAWLASPSRKRGRNRFAFAVYPARKRDGGVVTGIWCSSY